MRSWTVSGLCSGPCFPGSSLLGMPVGKVMNDYWETGLLSGAPGRAGVRKYSHKSTSPDQNLGQGHLGIRSMGITVVLNPPCLSLVSFSLVACHTCHPPALLGWSSPSSSLLSSDQSPCSWIHSRPSIFLSHTLRFCTFGLFFDRWKTWTRPSARKGIYLE